jgi:hypothetical protein
MKQYSLHARHETELISASGIDRELVGLNFVSLEGNSVYDWLFISAELTRNNIGQVTPGWLRRYQHCIKGGWWCSGLDPLHNWEPMEWGTFKPNSPTKNRDDKIIKYEHPPNTSTRIFCLRVTPKIWQQTARMFQVKLPLFETNINGEAIGYWQWIIEKKIPIVICEGVKKAAKLLTHGYPAIGLPGINSGYRAIRDLQGNLIGRNLIPELALFSNNKQEIYICFDFETVPRKIKLVDTAIYHLGELFQQKKCQIKVIRLPGEEKGVDDFITAKGISAFEEIYRQALDLETDIARSKSHHELTYPASLTLNSRYLHKIDFPATGIVGIKSAKGTGKTTALIPLVTAAQQQHRPILLLTHRIQLGRFLCQRIGVNWINANLPNKLTDSLGLCMDSMWKLNPSDWEGGVIILDEVEQSLWHLLHSSTCKKKRLAILKTFQNLISRTIQTGGLIIAQDADLSDISIDYLKKLADTEIEPWIVVNQWQIDRGWDVHFYDLPNPTALIHQLELDLLAGYKCYVTTDSRGGRYGSDTIDRYIQEQLKKLEDRYTKTLVVCSHTTNTIGHPAVDFVSAINTQAPEYDAVFVTPTLGTGVSIDVQHFDRVYGIFQGVIPDPEVRQALARVRANVPRYLWCAKKGIGKIGSGSNNYRTLAYWYQENYKENYALMCPMTRLDVDLPYVYDPIHLRTWSKFAARINASINLYREAVKAGLMAEGHQIELINEERDRQTLAELRTALMHAAKTDPQQVQIILREIAKLHKQKDSRDRKHSLIEKQTKTIQTHVKMQAAIAVAEATDLRDNQYQILTRKRFLSDAERAQVEKYQLQQRYGITITPELKIKNDKGYYGQLVTHFYLTHQRQYLSPSFTASIDTEMQLSNDRLFLPDVNHHLLKIQGLLALGIDRLLDGDREFQETDPDLVSLKRISYLCSQHIKRAIGINLPIANPDRTARSQSERELSPIAVFNKFLQLLGLKVKTNRRIINEHGQAVKIYQLDPSLLNDERLEVFAFWEHQQSTYLAYSA